jgi:hypothetical protein
MQGVNVKGVAVYLFVALGCLLIAGTGVMIGCGSSESSPITRATTPRAASRAFAKATLRPFGDGKAIGTAVLVKESGHHTLKVNFAGLSATHGEGQYGLWQLQAPRDRVSLQSPDNMVALATYRVGSNGRLAAELETTAKAYLALEDGKLTHFLVTKIDSPASLQEAIVRFDNTGDSPDLGTPIAEGTFKGSLVGAVEPR